MSTENYVAGEHALALMQTLATWQNTTTIILHGGCVFEFKGIFPRGELAEGFYNLGSGGAGFEGHIKLQAITRIRFQSRTHRGRDSHALVFAAADDAVIFKVFLGRDSHGELHAEQLAAFHNLQSQLTPSASLMEHHHEK